MCGGHPARAEERGSTQCLVKIGVRVRAEVRCSWSLPPPPLPRRSSPGTRHAQFMHATAALGYDASQCWEVQRGRHEAAGARSGRLVRSWLRQAAAASPLSAPRPVQHRFCIACASSCLVMKLDLPRGRHGCLISFPTLACEGRSTSPSLRRSISHAERHLRRLRA